MARKLPCYYGVEGYWLAWHGTLQAVMSWQATGYDVMCYLIHGMWQVTGCNHGMVGYCMAILVWQASNWLSWHGRLLAIMAWQATDYPGIAG